MEKNVSERSEWSNCYAGVGTLCREWWTDLTDVDRKTGREKANGANPDRAALAALRRIGVTSDGERVHVDLVAAATVPAYVELRKRLLGLTKNWRKSEEWDWLSADQGIDERVAVVAASLAGIREDVAGGTTAAVLGRRDSRDEQPLMAEARLKRLMRTRTRSDLLLQGRRVIALLDGKVPVADLGASLLLWGPLVQRRWAFAYYQQPDPDSDADAEFDGAVAATSAAA